MLKITQEFGLESQGYSQHNVDFLDVYLGVENISNFFQQNPIQAAATPFSPYFDASMVWGPISGRMLYVGWRIKIK